MISSISSNTGKVELEKAEAAQKTKNKIGGLGGSESYYLIPGKNSPVLFNKKDVIQLSRVGVMGMGATQADEVEIECRKQAGNTYLIIPKKLLKPGQYAFVDMLGADVDDSCKNVSYQANAFMAE